MFPFTRTSLELALGGTALIASSAAAAPLGQSPNEFRVPLFEMIDLGDLGGPSSMALDIDESGRVVGEADTRRLHRRAYLWGPVLNPSGPSVMNSLDASGAGLVSSAWALNELGQIVGHARDAAWNHRPVLWSGDALLDLGTLGGPEGFALDINDHGVIVGTADSRSWGHVRPFVFADGAMLALPTPADASGVAFAINDAGTVVGKYALANGEHAMMWRRAQDADGWVGTDLHAVRGINSAARAINEHGDVAGWAQNGPQGSDAHFYRACVWRRGASGDGTGAVLELGTLPGMRTSSAIALNFGLEVVGTSAGEFPEPDRAFYWSENTGMLDLNDLIGNRDGRHMVTASGINDAGDIIGYVIDNGAPRAVVLRVLP